MSSSTLPGIPVRRPASEVPRITGLRILPQGAEAVLVNISVTGLLAETTARLLAGNDVDVRFEGTFYPPTVSGRVVRSQVSVMRPDGGLRYHIAIEFNSPIVLDDDASETTAAMASTVRNRW